LNRRKKKLLIFWDGAGWHRGSKVQEFIKQDKNTHIQFASATLWIKKFSNSNNG